jgi:E3 ubiquitin-protein ligase Topors
MTIFLRRELLVWPNADVEVCVPTYYIAIPDPRLSTQPNLYHFEPWQFLVTFVISLMKSIDIRTESAVKLLAEFLDMETQYVAGERHVNAEHFAHGPSEFWALLPPFAFCSHLSPPLFFFFLGFLEIYCYLRSPYRDLGVYDSVVQVRTHCNRGDMRAHG